MTLDPADVIRFHRAIGALSGFWTAIALVVLIPPLQLLTIAMGIWIFWIARTPRPSYEIIPPASFSDLLNGSVSGGTISGMPVANFLGMWAICGCAILLCAIGVHQRRILAIYAILALTYACDFAALAMIVIHGERPIVVALAVGAVIGLSLILITAHRGLRTASMIRRCGYKLDQRVCLECRTIVAAEAQSCPNCLKTRGTDGRSRRFVNLMPGILSTVAATLLLGLTGAMMAGWLGYIFAIPFAVVFVFFEAAAIRYFTKSVLQLTIRNRLSA